MEKQQGRQQENWSTVPVSEKMAKSLAAPATGSEKTARLMQAKLMKLAEKAFKRQTAVAATGKPFTAAAWQKRKNKNKIAKKSRKQR